VGEDLGSILLKASILLAAAAAAVLLTVARGAGGEDPEARNGAAKLLLLGIALHCLHVAEEFVTGLHRRLPELLDVEPWSDDFFVIVNLLVIALVVLSSIGLAAAFLPAMAPAWFFAIAMAANGVAHPALAVAVGGYFPGLVTSPIVGVVGAVLVRRLWGLTAAEGSG